MVLMKIIIDGCEVEIRAKDQGKPRYNKEDTMYVLNTLSILAREASRNFEKEGSIVFARKSQAVADMIYDLLDRNGLYDTIKDYDKLKHN